VRPHLDRLTDRASCAILARRAGGLAAHPAADQQQRQQREDEQQARRHGRLTRMTDHGIDPKERRRGFLALVDDLDRWIRTCRDAHSDMQDPEIAEALETLSRRIRERLESGG
jgi:hypothetical protein